MLPHHLLQYCQRNVAKSSPDGCASTACMLNAWSKTNCLLAAGKTESYSRQTCADTCSSHFKPLVKKGAQQYERYHYVFLSDKAAPVKLYSSKDTLSARIGSTRLTSCFQPKLSLHNHIPPRIAPWHKSGPSRARGPPCCRTTFCRGHIPEYCRLSSRLVWINILHAECMLQDQLFTSCRWQGDCSGQIGTENNYSHFRPPTKR